MSAKFTTDSLEAAHSVLEGGFSYLQASQVYHVALSTVYRTVDIFTPWNRGNKNKLKKLLTR